VLLMFTYFVYEPFSFNRLECDNGRFGPNCVHACSGNCLNGVPCDKSTGMCKSCKVGYKGDLCNNSKCLLALDTCYVSYIIFFVLVLHLQFSKLTLIVFKK
jgi:hypothetical protein